MTAPAAAGAVAAEQSLAASAQAFYALLAALSANAAQLAGSMWDGLDPADLVRSWNQLALPDRLLVTTGVAQQSAATAASRYVTEAVAAQAAGSAGELLNPASLVGIASDGRDLDDLLASPLIRALEALGKGATGEQAKAAGRAALTTIVGTQVADTGRAATTVAMTADPRVTGYVRMLTPPSCGRCAVLAGRRYAVNAGFSRHPLCDCVHVPAVEDVAGELATDPDAYFNSLTAADQDKYFTKAGAEAIRQGANIGQVVNARRGASGLEQPGRLTKAEVEAIRGSGPVQLRRVDVYGRQLAVTTEGTTKRGIAGKRLIAQRGATELRTAEERRADRARGDTRRQPARAKTPRLMPEAIAELAGGDREEHIRLLKRFGYIL